VAVRQAPPTEASTTYYDRLGVDRDADLVTLRQAYRRLALRLHPDIGHGSAEKMAELNALWAVLSDPQRRAAYDRTLTPMPSPAAPGRRPGAHTAGTRPIFATRREAWFASVALQARRLGSEAARSASTALAQRHRRPRALYDSRIDEIVTSLGTNTEERVTSARAAGTAPLDLSLVTALLGVRACAATTLAATRLRGSVTERDIIEAELLDRMWDNLAHGISREIEQAVGGNPRLLRALTGRRV